MKELSEITGLALILFVVLKIIDFANLGFFDIVLIALFGLYAVLVVITAARKRGKR